MAVLDTFPYLLWFSLISPWEMTPTGPHFGLYNVYHCVHNVKVVLLESERHIFSSL